MVGIGCVAAHHLAMMQILFVHGMGRSPLSAWPMLRRLRQAGYGTSTFSYLVSLELFDAIAARLAKVIAELAGRGPIVLIGHSLGGVLIRAALVLLDPAVTTPSRVFLLASPQTASRMAQGLHANRAFRLLSGDCGQVLASASAMACIPPIDSPTTAIVGVRPIAVNRAFGSEANDGVVALSEVRAAWLSDEVQLQLIHSVLPASRAVAEVVQSRLEQDRTTRR